MGDMALNCDADFSVPDTMQTELFRQQRLLVDAMIATSARDVDKVGTRPGGGYRRAAPQQRPGPPMAGFSNPAIPDVIACAYVGTDTNC